MFLYKSAGATYMKVVRQSLHAFPHGPTAAREDEFVLLSKNRKDCSMLEKQIQYTAKVQWVRHASGNELDHFFPGIRASTRWRSVIKLYWVKPLTNPFSLAAVPGLDYRRYATVQGFAKFDAPDEKLVFDFLCASNADTILDLVNKAERPSDGPTST
jgi:hypothetical protein